LATGRLHPGESQGSWMMEGFIRYLLSPEAHFLRDKMVFKIVPMVNVDGVVLGNFRTGISGRDLNRVFTSPNQYKEI
jgi:murein tripeptide amidase MpaA